MILYKVIFWLSLVSVAVLSIVVVPDQQLFIWNDKVNHLLAYGVLFWLLLNAYGLAYKIWILAVLLMLFGVLIEVAQSFTGYRQADLFDLLANFGGIVLVTLPYMARRSH